MSYLSHQVTKGTEAYNILKTKGYVYIAGKPRSGKTATSIYVAEQTKRTKWLVLCPKNAIGGWHTMLNMIDTKHEYYVTNYEQLGSIKGRKFNLKLNPNSYDGVIVDESHNFGKLGKPSNRIKLLQYFMGDKVHIHLSGTAIVESPNGIYHQMNHGKWKPFRHKNFYDYFRDFGLPYYIKAHGMQITQYDRADWERLQSVVDSFTVYMTQADAGIDAEATDEVHYVPLEPSTSTLLRELEKELIIQIYGAPLVCDTTMKLRTSLHMIEGGVVKLGDSYISLGNTEKVDYIKSTFGDTKDIGIMCHFVGERKLLESNFLNATIYSSTSHAEGVDLSHLKHFIIYSSGYSGAKFIQRRERIVNINGSNTLKVHHLLCKGQISEMVYKTCSKKQDFNNMTYKEMK